ncbi:MAG: LacI family transcriptional regulator [Armatimonadota bacterium]|nr:MAG: LacI family transcriptional regulator [Armatimonadota bacterium]
MRVTIKDIANRLNLSTATVSKVLSGRESAFISEATRQKVLETAREMGYRPNRVARALVTGKTDIISLWAETLAPYHTEVVNLLMDQMRPYGFELIVTDMVKHPDWRAYCEKFPQWQVDGIIALDSPRCVRAYREANPMVRTPLVSIGAYYVEEGDFVGVDLYSGATEAVQHLLQTGCRRPAYLVCEYGNHVGDARYDGYTFVMQQSGLEPLVIVAEQSSRPSARQRMHEYLDEYPCPDGLFCFNDEMAIGAYRALCERGIRVPDDVAIVGCDGIMDTEYLERPLSTVVQPVAEMCRLGWEFLLRRIENPSVAPQQVLLKAHLVVRDSSRRG